MDPSLQYMMAKLGELAVKNTASVVFDKIGTVKAKKNDAQTISELTEIIQDLINDKQELMMIAQGLEKEFVSQELSENDIKMISDTIIPTITKFAENADDGGKMEEGIATIKPLLSKETINIMQTLGFNFKKAIGEPLTELMNNKIKSFESSSNEKLQLASAERDKEYFKLLQQEDGLDRLRGNK
ncbi:hypothetical protein [Convivina praedatoris]|uniref:hypothetical protein n=1 Tax=Convivina praedatoris TaxID=2880963 RepID=UPI00200D30FB|nr:hypothetical protein [Convivina sp. LMG 32447]CAH1857486.1 hypothetical protein R078138_01588 [Convivina sp. LMG 32447]